MSGHCLGPWKYSSKQGTKLPALRKLIANISKQINKIIPPSNKFSEALHSSWGEVVKNQGGRLWRVWSEEAS